jgi:predicted aldo/keto reductase-like oxidoreductase
VKTITLGETGLEVSRIGFGGIPIVRLSEPEAVRVVRHCLDAGITFLDTANSYSTSEERIGMAIVGRREGLVIATKTTARDKATAQEHLDLSLRRLNTDVVDLWQLHNVSSIEAYERVLGPGGALEAAREARQAGKVKHIGISSHSLDVALKAADSGLFETMQFPLNYITTEAADELLPLTRQQGMGYIAMKPFGGGMLHDARLSIKYLLQFDDVLPDPGIETVEELEEIVALVEGPWELTAAEQQEIERLRVEVGTRFCRRCDYCQPCPEGVRISMILHLRGFWRRFPPEVFYTGWASQAAASARACVECGECEERCPYHLPIREMLAENLAFYDRTVVQRP